MMKPLFNQFKYHKTYDCPICYNVMHARSEAEQIKEGKFIGVGILDTFNHPKNCPFCGVHLDWSDIDTLKEKELER